MKYLLCALLIWSTNLQAADQDMLERIDEWLAQHQNPVDEGSADKRRDKDIRLGIGLYEIQDKPKGRKK